MMFTRKIILPALALMLYSLTGFAQVKRISLPQLNRRISNADTVYIVNFWATWCAPCVAELPYFDKLQATYRSRPLKVLLISMDFESKYSSVKAFAAKRQFKCEVFLATRKSDQELIDGVDKNWSGALPGTLIVNAKRGIRQFQEREFTYDELEKLYQNNK
jgi:thiol-disulfide isomerase/thioredoxin